MTRASNRPVSIVWRDGAFLEAPQAAFSIDDRGPLLGDGAFETLSTTAAGGADVEEHLARLNHGLRLMRIPLFDVEHIDQILARLHRLNVPTETAGVARIVATRGVGERGLAGREAPSRSTRLVTVTPAAAAGAAPVRLFVSRRVRPTFSSLNAFKSLSGYAENQLARFEALDEGCDEALLLNEHGRIACAATANVFLCRPDGVIATPATTEGAMPGIARGRVLRASQDLGVEIREDAIAREDVDGAWLFLTNSLIGVRRAFLGAEPPSANGELIGRLEAHYFAQRTADGLERNNAP